MNKHSNEHSKNIVKKLLKYNKFVKRKIQKKKATAQHKDRSTQFEKIFDDVEHTYIYTDDAIRRLVETTDLQIISLDHRTSIAGEIIVLKKP